MKYSTLHKNKHFFIVMLALALFFGCTSDEQYKRPIHEGDNILVYKGYNLETVEYDGHDYIICRDVSSGYHSLSITHSASCKKCSIQQNNQHRTRRIRGMITLTVGAVADFEKQNCRITKYLQK